MTTGTMRREENLHKMLAISDTLAIRQAGAPIYLQTWLDGTNAKPESWAFGTHRAIPRPWESFP